MFYIIGFILLLICAGPIIRALGPLMLLGLAALFFIYLFSSAQQIGRTAGRITNSSLNAARSAVKSFSSEVLR